MNIDNTHRYECEKCGGTYKTERGTSWAYFGRCFVCLPHDLLRNKSTRWCIWVSPYGGLDSGRYEFGPVSGFDSDRMAPFYDCKQLYQVAVQAYGYANVDIYLWDDSTNTWVTI